MNMALIAPKSRCGGALRQSARIATAVVSLAIGLGVWGGGAPPPPPTAAKPSLGGFARPVKVKQRFGRSGKADRSYIPPIHRGNGGRAGQLRLPGPSFFNPTT
jgi:hypothetical protein